MTNVIAFKIPSRTGATRDRDGRGAEMLFFTGVRYVRDEPPQPAAEDLVADGSSAASPPAVADERLQA